MTFRGTIVNGRVVLEAGAAIPEGTTVDVQPVRSRGRSSKKPKGADLLALTRFAVRTGIRDLASEHDHYLHGTPKRSKRKPARRRKK